MSFDIAIDFTNKDISFNQTGQVKTVSGYDKLIQGISKVVITEKGTNALHPLYGSTIYTLLGSKITDSLRSSLLGKTLGQAIFYLKGIQQTQQAHQYTTPKEMIGNADSVSVTSVSPTEIAMTLNVTTQYGIQVAVALNVSEG